MPPREPPSTAAIKTKDASNEIKVGPNKSEVEIISPTKVIVKDLVSKTSYIRCQSIDEFHHDPLEAEKVNKELNLNLGIKYLDPMNPTLRKICAFLSRFFRCVGVERMVLRFWASLPLWFRHWLTMNSWAVHLYLHKLILGRRTGIHPDASEEYHALTTVCYWGRMFPVTVKLMRFSLNQIQVIFSPCRSVITHTDHGILLKHKSAKPIERKDAEVIFWIYGGAYLAGDSEGNLGLADKVAEACQCHVFLVNYRLLPEYEFDDALADVYDGYMFLLQNYSLSPSQVRLFGISSGGGLAVSLMQRIVKEDIVQQAMPRGAVLLSPFVDYTEPKGSFKEYTKHDLIVNQSVFEVGIPYFEIKLGSHENRKQASPVYCPLHSLPPLCVVASQHETCYDQSILLVNKARQAGVSCTLGVWQYMCHVFPVLNPLIPEGRQAMDFVYGWIKDN